MCGSVDELLAPEDVEIVDIAIAPDAQVEVATKAIKHRKHALCQKPLAETFVEAERLVALAEAEGVLLAVNQQMRDLGIRLALGASRFDIVRAVFTLGGRPVLRGLFFGLWLSVGLAASLRQNMSGTPLRLDSSDPLLYGGAAFLLALAALLAMMGPARRGSKCDPLEALRCD